MGWFDEQIRLRKKNDEQVFEDSFKLIGDAVYGKGANKTKDSFVLTNEALENILKFYGLKMGDIPKEITDINERIEYVCRPNGIMYRRVKLTPSWYKDAIGAMLAFDKETDMPIALIPNVIKGYCFIKDGKIIKVNNKNENIIKEDAYCFYKPFPLRKISPLDLIKYAIETRTARDNIITLSLFAITTLIGLLVPKITNFLMNDVVNNKSVNLLISTLIFMLCVNISSTLFGVVRTIYDERINNKTSLYVDSATMIRVLSLPAIFFRKYSSGELNQRVSYVSSLTSALMSVIFQTSLTSLFSLAYITSIFEFAPTLVIPSLIIIVVTVICSLISMIIMTKRSKRRMESESKQSGISYAMISGIQKIKNTGSEKRAFARWAEVYASSARNTYKPEYVTVISNAISLIGTTVIYYLAIKAGISQADYYSFNTAYGMVTGAFMSLSSIVMVFANIKPILEMAKPIMDAIPEVSENRKVVTRIHGGVEFNNVSFRYADNMPMVIDNLSFKIRPGQYVAIVGKTGCGKSTLIRLLLGFEKPLKGAVYYDGLDVQTLDLKSLRRKIGVVMQDGKLFSGDIFSNISISAPWINVDDAWKAADMAGIGDDIRQMPMGMNTIISEGSGGISGGQRQRLMIARAIAPKPRILIFDEATSALDNITQKKVSESLDSLKCTRIVIAHRLSTIKHCDRIMYLEDGKIIEDGTYEELINLNGKFAELVERQRIDN